MKPKKPTKISIALAFLAANPGATRYAAAEHAGMRPTALYTKLKRDKAKEAGVCPACQRPLTGETK